MASLLTGSSAVVKGGGVRRIYTDGHQFLQQSSQCHKPLGMSLCIPRAGITNSNPLIGALFIYSFIPQISSEHLQHIRHLSRYWRYNSEQSKWDSLPSRIFQVGVHDLWDVWCHIQSCLSLLESGRSALFYPTQSTIYPCSQHILIEHLLHARALLLLLLSRFSHVQLCATPEMTAHQAPPSLGFSRQEHWSGLPFPSPMPEP